LNHKQNRHPKQVQPREELEGQTFFSARPKPLKAYLEPTLTVVSFECKRAIAVLSRPGEAIELDMAGAPEPVLSVSDNNGFIVRTVHAWLSHIGRLVGLTYSEKTVPQYGKIMTYLVRWIEKHPPMPGLSVDENIIGMNRDDVIDWLKYMKKHGAKSNKTLISREVCLYECLDWLCTADAGNVRDMENSPRGRDNGAGNITKGGSQKSPKLIDTDVVVRVLNGFHNECERCMFHAQYDMGPRISELIGLTLRDLPNEASYDSSHEFIPICINGVKGRGGTAKERITLISRAVLRRIRAYHNTIEYRLAPGWAYNDLDKPVFLTVNQLTWQARNATKQFDAAVARAGLPDNLRPHWLRHGTAFSVLRSDAGKDYADRVLIVQQMLGHSDLRTTEIYTQISPAMLDKLTKSGSRINRLEEAETIRRESWLAPLRHKESRGHSGSKHRSDHAAA
jgi:integrase/recombinase XerD